MDTRVDEIADGIYRICTVFTDETLPGGFSVNQFLVLGEEPLLFHCGYRELFGSVSAVVQRVLPVRELRWISFGHVEADECGSMNHWLDAAPHAQVMQGALGCDLSVRDMADRPPRQLADGEVLDLGGKRIRLLDTPHVPHNWEAIVLYEETTRTLLCGDLFTHVGDGPALVERDPVGPAIEAEAMFHAHALGPHLPRTLNRLAELEPATLALMHGSSFTGAGGGALRSLAGVFHDQLLAELNRS
ncbi:MAG: hypothetical protein ACRDSE_06585 [Pseudonocardiaceae bacterium]